MIRISLLLLLAATFSMNAHAFPENVRHRYPNCVSCHINPNGQGNLNEYGRQLSKAVQSYGKFFFEPGPVQEPAASAQVGDDQDKEVEFLYGAFPHPKWLSMGGDLRFLQLFSSTPAYSQARSIVMQLDLEAAVTVGRLTIDATVGRDDPVYKGVQNPGFGDYLISRRHYLLYQVTDEVFVMGGRFWKPHGILDANHVSAVKRYLGWDFSSESYNIEAGYLGANYNLMAYADFGRPDNTYQQIEKGGGATASINLNDSFKLGGSYFYGYTDFSKRHVFGPWGILGFTEHFYLRSENDFVQAYPQSAGASTFGYADYSRLGYEFVQGFHVYLEQGFNQLDLTQVSSQVQIYGLGSLYYPRPHWEFEADFQMIKTGGGATSQGFNPYIYFQAHYSL